MPALQLRRKARGRARRTPLVARRAPNLARVRRSIPVLRERRRAPFAWVRRCSCRPCRERGGCRVGSVPSERRGRAAQARAAVLPGPLHAHRTRTEPGRTARAAWICERHRRCGKRRRLRRAHTATATGITRSRSSTSRARLRCGRRRHRATGKTGRAWTRTFRPTRCLAARSFGRRRLARVDRARRSSTRSLSRR